MKRIQARQSNISSLLDDFDECEVQLLHYERESMGADLAVSDKAGQTMNGELGLFEEGKELIRVKEYKKAIKCLIKLYELGSTRVALCYYIAKCYQSLQQLKQAQQWLQKQIEYHPNHLQSLFELARHLIIEQNYNKAIFLCLKVVSIVPEHERGLRMLGQLYLLFSEEEKALKVWQFYSSKLPQNQQGYIGLAQTYVKLGYTTKAVQVLEQAMKSGVNNEAEILNKLSLIYAEQQIYQQAITIQCTLVKNYPQESRYALNLAMIYLKASMQSKALCVLESVTDADVRDKEQLWSVKGQALLGVGRLSEGFRCYSQLVDWCENIQDIVRAEYYRGMTEYGNKQYDKAIGHFQAVINKTSSNIHQFYLKHSYLYLSNCHVYLNHLSQAEDCLKTSLKEFEDDFYFTYSLANVYRLMDQQFDLAKHFFEQALQINQSHYMLHLHYGMLFKKHMMYDDAEEHFTKAIKINPKCCEAYRCLGKLSERKKKLSEAIKFFKKYVRICDEQSLISESYLRTVSKLSDLYLSLGEMSKHDTWKQKYEKKKRESKGLGRNQKGNGFRECLTFCQSLKEQIKKGWRRMRKGEEVTKQGKQM